MTPPSTRARHLLLWILMPALFATAPKNADAKTKEGPVISLESSGFVIASPDGTRLQLGYPTLLDEAQKATESTGATIESGKAIVDYPAGVKLSVERKGSSFTFHFTGLTNASKAFRMEMSLPGDFKDDGTWQLKGSAATPFPQQFNGEQFLFKGNPTPVTLKSAKDGSEFTIAMPYGWQQLQDGRKWNGDSFDYMFSTAMPSGDGNEAWFSFKLWPGDADHEPVEAAAKPPVVQAQKPSLQLTREGLAIEAGAMGKFTLEYPVLVGARWDDVHKPIERTIAGNNASIRFDGDAHIDVAWEPKDGTLTLTARNLPGGVKNIRQSMLIDFGLATGGTWKAGDGAETPFPAQKPDNPHIYQGTASSLTLRDIQGSTLKLDFPAGSFQQLTDNREWGWKIFAWQYDAPVAPDSAMVVKITLGAASGEAVKLADRFGQSTRLDFAAKVKTESELQDDIKSEAAWSDAFHPPVLDPYGGQPDSGEKLGLKTTGYFHVQKSGDRWILVDPAGNEFFHLGICAFNPADDYTYVAGRENLYEWLPPHEGEFATAYHPDQFWNPLALSFHLVNTIRKTGRPYDKASYTQRMIERARKWGFNSAGAFSAPDAPTLRAANFPYVAHLPLATWEGFADIPGTHGVFDPFSDTIRAHCDELFSQRLPQNANDQLLIGYFLANEPLYEEIPAAVAALDGSYPCKQQLAKMLEQRYQTIDGFNAAWKTNLTDFTQVAAHGLPVSTDIAKKDMQDYTGIFLDTYFRLVTETFHKYDKNHMLIGNRFQPGTINNETLCRLSGKYMDLVSFNYYTYALDRPMLARVHGWIGDRPMFFSEFYFDSPSDSGLTGGGKDVSTQQERGLAYRQYVEQAAALGYVVGIEWFTLIDQATTGRFFEKYGGESANTGLISVTDRPWRPMIEEMTKTNYTIYDVCSGQRPPFVFDDPRFAPTKQH